MTISFCIVVARYNEDIEWCKQFPNVIIYNKGDKLHDRYNEIVLPNVGREGHTYYKHICDNYDNLTDYIIFLQGRPFDHSPNIVSTLNNIISTLSKYNNSEDLDIDFEFLSESIIQCNLAGCMWHPGLPLRDTYETLFNVRKEYMEFAFGGGAQFIVSKRCVLKKPKSFYDKIVELLQNNIDPVEGYVMERFHGLIFE
jgi:hypothetical protein